MVRPLRSGSGSHAMRRMHHEELDPGPARRAVRRAGGGDPARRRAIGDVRAAHAARPRNGGAGHPGPGHYPPPPPPPPPSPPPPPPPAGATQDATVAPDKRQSADNNVSFPVDI